MDGAAGTQPARVEGSGLRRRVQIDATEMLPTLSLSLPRLSRQGPASEP